MPAKSPINGSPPAGMQTVLIIRRSATSTTRISAVLDSHGITSLARGGGSKPTPVVVDGVMYAAGNWGRVYALDAASGRELWTYDPQVDGQWGRYACCDAVNRGLAVWKGRVYVASLDGYLHAIDARTGRRVWRVDTLPERGANAFHYFVTGAPVVAGDSIVIGNGGSDFKGARGWCRPIRLLPGHSNGAFTRCLAIRAWGRRINRSLKPRSRPGPPSTTGAWAAEAPHGTVSPTIRSSASSLRHRKCFALSWRSRCRRQDRRLFVASIIALHADTGEMAWYYQEIPGEGWDYDTTNKLVLADVEVGGKTRKAIMQASKNGYLYVLDRTSGEFLSGKPFAYVNWTKGLDPATHRPVVQPAADWERKPALLFPAAAGAHSWQPMSYDPMTRLVYIPVIDAAMVYVDTSKRRAGLIEGSFDLAFFFPEDYDPKDLAGLYGDLPPLRTLTGGRAPPKSRGFIRAVQPMSGKVVWERQTESRWDGGVLSTGGNLVVQGDAAGYLTVYAADTGKLLKRIDVGTSIMAAPMTYRVDGVQYVSVMAGFGGGLLYLPFPQDSAAFKYGNDGRIVTFRLDGGAVPKPPQVKELPAQAPPPREGTAASIAQGEVLYNRYCARCHAFGRGLLPDLRRLSTATHSVFYEIVLRGAYQAKGMGRWDDVLSQEDAAAIHAYLVDQAWQLEKTP